MKINEVLQEENIGNVYIFYPEKDSPIDESLIVLKPYGQPELFFEDSLNSLEEEKIEDVFYLRAILDGEFELIHKYTD